MTGPQDAFYAQLAQVAFTILGFWLAIVQLRPDTVLVTPSVRRAAHAVSIQLMLPAVMALLALADPGNGRVWRASFVLGAAFGVVAVVALAAGGRLPPALIVAHALVVAGYVAVAVVALAPHGTLPFASLDAEAVLFGGLVFVALNEAFWLLFRPPAPDGAARQDR